METTLVFDRVWKRFRRGQVHDSLRELIPAVVRRVTGAKRPELEERDFWALRNISFEVKPSEVLGIIGGNGAGKSTSLKILNELMEPTKGRVHIEGKVGSLIEVAAGFHQDLTGRQNVFLQGAIMGMRKAEVRQKFDQIVEFAGIEEFIDTPVKRYSSGMNARLGFSIAAHLEPDVLIIDEVLAVGDHAFQARAFAKIKKMATGGIPVVLVSHQLDRIAELCTKVILLERGQVKAEGSASECINAYLHPPESEQFQNDDDGVGVRFNSISSLNGLAIMSGEDLSVVFTGESLRAKYPHGWQLGFFVRQVVSGNEIHTVRSPQRGVSLPLARKFEHRLDIQMNVPPGNYVIGLVLWDDDSNQHVLNGPRINVEVMEKNKFWGTAQLNSRWSEVG